MILWAEISGPPARRDLMGRNVWTRWPVGRNHSGQKCLDHACPPGLQRAEMSGPGQPASLTRSDVWIMPALIYRGQRCPDQTRPRARCLVHIVRLASQRTEMSGPGQPPRSQRTECLDQADPQGPPSEGRDVWTRPAGWDRSGQICFWTGPAVRDRMGRDVWTMPDHQ